MHRTLLGMVFFCFLAWIMSSNRKRFPLRITLVGLSLQILLGAVILQTTYGRTFFETLSSFVIKIITMAKPATALVFGQLAEADGPVGPVFAFLGTGLPVIIFFSAFMSVLYHLRIMQILIFAMARIMKMSLGVSGAESMAMAANVFLGQTEAPLVVRPYLERMTRSELNAMMTGGFATIAGSVLALYIALLGTDFGVHILAASVMSAPAAFVVAKIMQPETEIPVTGGGIQLQQLQFENKAHNVIEAAANGTTDGLKLWLNVLAMLIAFMGLVALINWPLQYFGAMAGLDSLSLQSVFGWILAPVAWFIGIETSDCIQFGSLLGTKIALNEFVAFTELQALVAETNEISFRNKRSAEIATYALCGFANFASVGIQMGGLTPLAPGRKSEIAGLALRAMAGGAMASWMTATVAGMFL